MKKLLALVLALVMTMSLATVSTNAAFEDAADISYTEAADVLSAVGVFVGDGKNFAPKAALNREQAAKLVAYLALGEDVAEALPAVAMFDDVAASSWAAKYIAYCADAGIITGDGAGKFFPTAPVDGYAFAKMLMCALGYKAEAEGFTGGNWSINVAKMAKELNLAKGGVELAANLTREQAAQMMFNAIKCYPVDKYEGSGSSVTIGNVVVQNDWGKAELETKMYYELTWDTTTTGILVYDDVEDDNFGRNGHKWTFDAESVGIYADETAKFVITEKMTDKEVAALLKGYEIKAVDTNTYDVDRDTTLNSAFAYAVDKDVDVNSETGESVAKEISDLTADGKVVELYAGSDMVIDQVVVIDYALTEVDDIDVDETTGDVTYTFNGVGSYVNDEDVTRVVFAGELAEDDIVTYTYRGGKLYVYPTTMFTGALTTYNTDGVYTIGGKGYTKSTAFAGTELSIGDAAEYYLDQYGYVVKTDAISTSSSNYAYVLGVLGKSATGFDGIAPAAQVKVLLADGTVAIYDVKVAKKDGGYYVVDADGNLTTGTQLLTEGKTAAETDTYFAELDSTIFSYVVTDNTIALKAVAGFDTAKGTYADVMYNGRHDTTYVAKNDASMVVYGYGYDAYLTSETTMIFWDDVDGEVDAVVKGSANLGDKTFGTNPVVVSVAEDGKVTVKYVFVVANSSSSTSTVDEYGFIDVSEYTTSQNSKKENVYTFVMTLADGSKIDVTSDTATFSNGDGLYSYESDKSVDPSNNYLNSSDGVVAGACYVNGTAVKIGSGFYTMTADTKVVDCSTTYNKMDDATVVAMTDDTGKILKAVFIYG